MHKFYRLYKQELINCSVRPTAVLRYEEGHDDPEGGNDG